MSLGSTIRELREKKNLTQPELAKAIGVATQTILRWEKDRRLPSVLEINKISETLGVPVDVLAAIAINKEKSIAEAEQVCSKIGIPTDDVYEALTAASLEVDPRGVVFHPLYSFLKNQAEQSGNRVALDYFENWLLEKFAMTKLSPINLSALTRTCESLVNNSGTKKISKEERALAINILEWALDALKDDEESLPIN